MKKEKRVEFGIEIVKPWSREMYDHNDEVAEVVKAKVHALWADRKSTRLNSSHT